MRCDCCDTILTDYEMSLKHKETHEYLNTCKKCLRSIGVIPYVGNKTLLQKQEPEESIDDFVEPEVEDYGEIPETWPLF